MSPKAPTNQRKKSSGFTEADRRLARAQQLMDADLDRPTVPSSDTAPMSTSNNPSANVQPSVRSVSSKREEKRRESGEREKAEHVRQKPQPVPVAPVQQKRSTSPMITADSSVATALPSTPASSTQPTAFTASYNAPTSSTMTNSVPMTRPSVIPVSAVHPTVYQTAITGTEPIPIPVMLPVIPTLIPGLTLPIGGMDMTSVSLGALAEYYGQMATYDESNMPATPTPSLASSIGTERTGGLREMNSDFVRSRRHSESEHSVASELSAAPDWLDEVVGPDDVDDDFSAMAAASEFLMSASGEDASSSRAQTPQPALRPTTNIQQPQHQQQQQQKRRVRRDKRRRGGRSSGNESASSSDKSHRNAIGAERVPKKTLAAELNEERRRREDEYLRNNNAGGLGDWPMPDLRLGSLIETDERVSGAGQKIVNLQLNWQSGRTFGKRGIASPTSAIVHDDARQAHDNASFQANNTWLCVPQLISNIACLTSVAAVSNGPGEALRRELMNESAEAGSTASNMPRTLMNLIGEELRQWENALHSSSKPGLFSLARRILVHPKFTKSYAYNTFAALNSLGVEMKILEGPSEMVQWIQKSLKAKGEEMYVRFHSDRPKMRYCSCGRTGILEVPTNAPNVFLYFVTDVERSTSGPQLVDMIREVQKHTFQYGGLTIVYLTLLKALRQRMVLKSPPFNVAHIKCPYTVIIYDDKKKMPVYFGRSLDVYIALTSLRQCFSRIVRPKAVDTKTHSEREKDEDKPRPNRWCRLS
ncbi:unnamed protein product [Haemonchus placei]|uniref:BZIP domain-containing protein n=1 Tax=Haemonchus placei TaxID=6290 RepID=A0A0N4WD39_HAEPC|nr:unnamed protein product [Haemonchus placei]